MLQASSLTTLPGIRHAFFTRSGGVSQGVYSSLNGGVGSGDAPEKVAENRARMAAALGVSADRLVTPFQIHSPDVVVVQEPWTRDSRPRADAVVTQVPRLAIGVSTADCGPLLFADSEAGVIGAALGPTIRQPNYEVGPEFIERFLAADLANTRYFEPSQREDHAMFDLCGYIAQRVEQAGLTQFEDLGLCTYEEPQRFYSFRRSTHRDEPDYGRHINAIALSG